MRTMYLLATILMVIGLGVAPANAAPGYHIDSDKSAKQALQQYGENNFQFDAVLYQAYLDKSIWRVAIASHDYLSEKPKDPTRECSFAQAYWKSQRAGLDENVPLAAVKRLHRWFEEAVRDTQDAVKKMPDSIYAHLTYGDYLQYFVMGMNKVPQMQAEFQKAVRLAPSVGKVHYLLADAYFSSGPLTRPQILTMIMEYKKAVVLDPRQNESYFALAACYYQLQDWRKDRLYLNKYLALHPELATRPDIIRTQAILREKLGS